MILHRVAPAVIAPVSLSEVRDHCRVDGGYDDAALTVLIPAAIDLVGQQTGRVLAPESWKLSVPAVAGDLTFPKSPVTAVTDITYFDSDDVSRDAAVADYYLFLDDHDARMRPKPGKVWPATTRRDDAISITFDVGYEVLPAALKMACLMMVGHLYEHREAVVMGATAIELPLGVQALIDPYRRGWVAA